MVLGCGGLLASCKQRLKQDGLEPLERNLLWLSLAFSSLGSDRSLALAPKLPPPLGTQLELTWPVWNFEIQVAYASGSCDKAPQDRSQIVAEAATVCL